MTLPAPAIDLTASGPIEPSVLAEPAALAAAIGLIESASSGCCTLDDLVAAGFTRAEIARLLPTALALKSGGARAPGRVCRLDRALDAHIPDPETRQQPYARALEYFL